MDDLIESHKDQCVLDNFIKVLNGKFGKGKKLEEMKGVVRDYLGLMIDFLLPGKVVFSIFNYLEEIVVEAQLNLKMRPRYKTLARRKLFTVDKDSPLLCKEKAELFHQLEARLLFSSK